MKRVVYTGERFEEEPGLTPRVLSDLRPDLQQAVQDLGGKVTSDTPFSVVVQVPEEAGNEVEEAISAVMLDRLMDSVHRTQSPILGSKGMISGGRFSPPVPGGA